MSVREASRTFRLHATGGLQTGSRQQVPMVSGLHGEILRWNRTADWALTWQGLTCRV